MKKTRLGTSVLVLVVSVLAGLSMGCTQTRESVDNEGEQYEDNRNPRYDGSTIHAEHIARSSEDTVEEILQGRVSGVVVLPGPDGGFRLRIRGAATFAASNEPLIVVDGRPLNNYTGGNIPVNPHDIETIRVLKSASEKAFYGIRGANGIISITTKRGK